jgi:hypothetical protein
MFSIYPTLPALGFAQPLRGMSTRSRKIMFLGSRAWPVHRADNLAADCLDNVGSLTSHNPTGLHGLPEGPSAYLIPV